MATEFSDTTLQEADAAIKASQAYRPSKAETKVNDIGTSVLNVTNSSFAAALKSDVAVETFSVVKDQVSNFVQHSKVLMSVLDEVAKAHPFVQVAVSLFKAGLTLELTRRENDEKVLALNVTMCDTMQVLTLLKRLADPKAPGADGLTIEGRLRQRMGAIVDTIKRCAKVCDSYQKRHTAVKFFTSVKWQGKFTEVAQQFADHKAAIQFDLQMHASVGVSSANLTLISVETHVKRVNENVVKLMEAVFERMRTPEERELSSLVASQPGGAEAVLKNDKLLEQVLSKQQKLAGGRDDNSKAGKRHGASGGQTDGELTIVELRKEVGKEVEQVLADNKFFDQKLDAMRVQVEEVKVTIKHETDRVIDAVLGGPHERIVDRDLYHIWKEMGWRGSVKARHLVMAVRDHFAEGSHAALAVIRDITTARAKDDSPDTAAQVVEEIAEIASRVDPNAPVEDQWALQFITVLRVQPLIEALDDDVSSFVTVAEVNAFTAARPLKWSLPHWIAYWTYGFEVTVQWYFRRIRKIIFEINRERHNVLPANRKIVHNFISAPQMYRMEDLLSGLHDVNDWDGTDWDSDITFLRFKDYVMETEQRMERALRAVNYCIDEANTLRMVAGEGRPEKYIMPILFLLMRRSLSIIRQARTVTLHHKELEIIQWSLWNVLDAVWDRVHTLQAVYRLQNLNEKEQLGKFFYGLYSYAIEEASTESLYWFRSPDTDAANLPDNESEDDDSDDGDDSEDDDDNHASGSDADSDKRNEASESTTGEPPLFYGPQTEDLDFVIDHASSATQSSDALTAHAGTRSLVGHWSGSYTYDSRLDNDGLVSFTIASHHPDGTVNGSGTDALGPFTVEGKVEEGGRLSFRKEYEVLQYGMKTAWRYEGMVGKDEDEIRGEWGPTDVEWNFEPKSEGAEDQKGDSVDVGAEVEDKDENKDEKGGQDEDESEEDQDEHEAGQGDDKDEQSDDDEDDGEEDSDEDGPDFIHGTFFLKRRPVEYLLSCPPDEEFEANRPRALWKLALNATLRSVQSRKMTWTLIAARRRQRQRYIELIKLREKTWRLKSSVAREWAELVKAIHPDDLHLWRCVAMFQMRREVVHDIICDACKARPLQPSRFICIVCSANEMGGSIDLCSGCFHVGKCCTREDTVHTPDHSVLQLRSVHWRSYRHPMFFYAKGVLSQAEDMFSSSDSDIGHLAGEDPLAAEGVCCVECEKPIESRPFWCCLDCNAMTVVCYECNKRTEREQMWLFEWRPNADYWNKHDWSHTLVSAPLPKGDGDWPGSETLSTEDRLARVEEKLDKQTAEMNARLAKLEELLERLLNGKN